MLSQNSKAAYFLPQNIEIWYFLSQNVEIQYFSSRNVEMHYFLSRNVEINVKTCDINKNGILEIIYRVISLTGPCLYIQFYHKGAHPCTSSSGQGGGKRVLEDFF